jgi:hypothetical protein
MSDAHANLKPVSNPVQLQSYTNLAECHGPVVNTPASYSGGARVKSQDWSSAILTEVLCGFPQSLQANAGIGP